MGAVKLYLFIVGITFIYLFVPYMILDREVVEVNEMLSIALVSFSAGCLISGLFVYHMLNKYIRSHFGRVISLAFRR